MPSALGLPFGVPQNAASAVPVVRKYWIDGVTVAAKLHRYVGAQRVERVLERPEQALRCARIDIADLVDIGGVGGDHVARHVGGIDDELVGRVERGVGHARRRTRRSGCRPARRCR